MAMMKYKHKKQKNLIVISNNCYLISLKRKLYFSKKKEYILYMLKLFHCKFH